MIIVSHNVFWFQGYPFATDRPGPADDQILEALCGMYRALSADVLCLQEIQDQTTFCAVQARLQMEGAYCPGCHLPQYGGAVFWRKGGRLVTDCRAAGSAIQRVWQLIEIQADALPLRIANVHLPSDRHLGPLASGPRRVEELRSILETPAGSPDLLAGDFNERPDGPVSECAVARGYADAAALAKREALGTTLGGSRGDWILIRRNLADRLVDYRTLPSTDLHLQREGKTHLSDHMPLWVTLKRSEPCGGGSTRA